MVNSYSRVLVVWFRSLVYFQSIGWFKQSKTKRNMSKSCLRDVGRAMNANTRQNWMIFAKILTSKLLQLDISVHFDQIRWTSSTINPYDFKEHHQEMRRGKRRALRKSLLLLLLPFGSISDSRLLEVGRRCVCYCHRLDGWSARSLPPLSPNSNNSKSAAGRS